MIEANFHAIEGRRHEAAFIIDDPVVDIPLSRETVKNLTEWWQSIRPNTNTNGMVYYLLDGQIAPAEEDTG